MGVAAGPIGAAEARVAQAREGAEQNEIEAEEENEPGERLQAQRRRLALAPVPDPGERNEREERADGEHAEQRREIVGSDRAVHCHEAAPHVVAWAAVRQVGAVIARAGPSRQMR